MNRIARISIATGLLAVAALGATAASAQVYGSISINLPGPPIAVMPAPPVYVRPAPVYVQPAPRHYAPAPVYYGRGPGYYGHERRGYYPTRWDRDGDGVPNRYDSRPNNPYRR